MGYASKMIYYLLDVYSKKYSSMIVGTAESGVSFMRSLDLFIHIKLKTFVDNYPEPIFEGELQCVDMLYLSYNF